MLRLSCAFILPWRESLGGGATCDGHHPFIRLRDTGGAHSTRLKGDAHLQSCAASVCSTSHAGLLAPVMPGSPRAAWSGVAPPETRLHSWGVVVSVECSSSTLPKSWQLCRKCKDPALRGTFLCWHEGFLIYNSCLEPLLYGSGKEGTCRHFFQERRLIDFVEAASDICVQHISGLFADDIEYVFDGVLA